MARSRRKEKHPIDELLDFLYQAPAWAGPFVAFFLFAACRWWIPWALSGSPQDTAATRTLSQVFSPLASQLSPFVGGGVLLLWGVAELKKWIDRRRLDGQTGLDSIQSLNWIEFESLLAEAFRRQGFVVEHTGSRGADDGIDLRLSKNGDITLVQCKHWKEWRVGVNIVRELLGVVASERAQAGIVVTSGRFTRDAFAFASKNPIRLIAAKELLTMISTVQRSGFISKADTRPASSSPGGDSSITNPDNGRCPVCGAKMVRRVAKQGKFAGSPFLGCSHYPECRFIRNLESNSK